MAIDNIPCSAPTDEMPKASYSFRSSAFAAEKNYRLHAEYLEWSSARHQGRIAYRDIDKMLVFKRRFLGSSASYWCSVLCRRSGKRIRLDAAHHARFRQIEDRTATYIPFIKALEARVQSCNPNASIVPGRSWLGRVEDLAGRLAVLLLRGFRRVDPARGGALAGQVLRLLGPMLRGHRRARANLVAAYPEKTADELETILAGMWGNLGRVLAEYAHLDRMWDYELADPKPGRIVMDQASADRLRSLSVSREPVLFFAAHLANWELAAVAPNACGREAAMLYRPPNIAPLAEELAKMREKCMTPIPADAFAISRVRDAIRRGACLGMLVDQHYADGVEVTFFGRSCKVHPMIARLARTFECKICGARIIRLPGNRFQFELTEAIDPPRDDSGKIAVAPTMQLLTHIIEGWIREYPEQWMWLHRRWR